MKYEEMVQAVQHLPIVESSALMALEEKRHALSVQLSRWVKSGRLIQLKRGVYLLPEYLRKVNPPPAYLANLLVRPSFVSFEYALSIHGLIPEGVPLVQSVTTGRTGTIETVEGRFLYRHVSAERFFGFSQMALQSSGALVAWPERALLDMSYFSRVNNSAQIEALRLQNFEGIDLDRLFATAEKYKSPKIERRAALYARYVERESAQWEAL